MVLSYLRTSVPRTRLVPVWSFVTCAQQARARRRMVRFVHENEFETLHALTEPLLAPLRARVESLVAGISALCALALSVRRSRRRPSDTSASASSLVSRLSSRRASSSSPASSSDICVHIAGAPLACARAAALRAPSRDPPRREQHARGDEVGLEEEEDARVRDRRARGGSRDIRPSVCPRHRRCPRRIDARVRGERARARRVNVRDGSLKEQRFTLSDRVAKDD